MRLLPCPHIGQMSYAGASQSSAFACDPSSPGLTSWGMLSRPCGTGFCGCETEHGVLGYSQPSPSTSSGQALRDCSRYSLMADLSPASVVKSTDREKLIGTRLGETTSKGGRWRADLVAAVRRDPTNAPARAGWRRLPPACGRGRTFCRVRCSRGCAQFSRRYATARRCHDCFAHA